MASSPNKLKESLIESTKDLQTIDMTSIATFKESCNNASITTIHPFRGEQLISPSIPDVETLDKLTADFMNSAYQLDHHIHETYEERLNCEVCKKASSKHNTYVDSVLNASTSHKNSQSPKVTPKTV